jgi:hypothetical protein
MNQARRSKIKASPTISIGHVSQNNKVQFANYKEATTAWLVLASMGIPAALDGGLDGWLPNTSTSSWRKDTGLDSNIPDISLTRTNTGFKIESAAMHCEVPATEENVWEVVTSIVVEYMDRVESGCWEVAA